MTFTRIVAGLVASVALLAACSKSASTDAAAQTPAPPKTSGGKAVAASGTEMPDMKPGLWEIHINHESIAGDVHGGVTQQCMDAKAIAEGKKTGADYAKANCSKNQTTRGGDGRWTSDLVCKVGDSTMTTHSVTTMGGENASYHSDVTVTLDPPVASKATTKTTMDGKWIGACKPT